MLLSELKTHDLQKVFIMGDAGSGKTVFAHSLPGPIKSFDFDGKIASAYGYLRKYNPDQLKEIDFEDCQPVGFDGAAFVKMNDCLEKIEKQFNAGERPYATLVIDSSTIMADELMKWLISFEKGVKRNADIKSIKVASQQDYGIFAPHFQELLHSVLRLPWNVVMTGHIAVKEDPKTKEVFRQAMIPGQMGKKIGVYFPEVYRSYVENGKYMAQTKADFYYPCRSQIAGLPEKIPLSYSELIKQR